MTRHAKNCTAGAVYTYHEKKKDTSASGYGSKNMRVGRDSIKEFDCCCLSLQPCNNPVVTPDGYLFDKEAILEYILHQKRTIARKLKEYEKQTKKEEAELQELAKAEQESQKNNFIQTEATLPGKYISQEKSATADDKDDSSISNVKDDRAKKLPSFWIPTLTPSSTPTLLKKPDEKVRCPMSGKPLRLKDLIDVEFTPIKDGDPKTALISKQARFVCAVTNDVLGNSVPAAVLRPTGKVVTMECVEKIIRKDMIDPLTGKKLTEKDIVQLQKGSTGFSGSGHELEAKIAGPSMQS
ncbi:nitric oxide synthase-interacting protein-like [Liolophura sinensis]|uniref:nitric oxide synthase-interacting protein-like n=1 Tax=Liolophura sinensis TaxID=3198878 RepID=UPI00315888FC